jgi:hypothetical protein
VIAGSFERQECKTDKDKVLTKTKEQCENSVQTHACNSSRQKKDNIMIQTTLTRRANKIRREEDGSSELHDIDREESVSRKVENKVYETSNGVYKRWFEIFEIFEIFH